MERILIIEDDKDLSQITASYLIREDYEVVCAYDGEDAIKKAREYSPSLILLDLNLPKLDGEEVIKAIRKFLYAPIIVISAKSDKLLSLTLGADDYITKPFSMKEMLARVNAFFRRKNLFDNANSTQRNYGQLKINTDKYEVFAEDTLIELTSKEFKLLDYLTLNSGIVFSKQQLMDSVWGEDVYVDESTITVTIARLREKLAKHKIENIKTVWGVGYKWT